MSSKEDHASFDNDSESQGLIGSKVKSQFYPLYEKLIGADHINDQGSYFSHLLTLKTQGIFHENNIFVHTIKFQVLEQTVNSNIMVLEARWGKFIQRISIINSSQKSKAHNDCEDSNFAKGRFARVYSGQIQNHSRYITKCLPLVQYLQNKAILMALKECFLLKIASLLKIGPVWPAEFGFDMVIYKDCVQIFMEKCEILSQASTRSNPNQLFNSLYVMHRFNIFHFDLKPQNIMYSPLQSRWVFIDFNLAQIRQQEFGYKSKMNFRGTLQYCYIQMFNLFNKRHEAGYVDPFYHDAFGLEHSIPAYNLGLRDNHCNYLQAQQSYEIQVQERSFDFLLYYRLKMLLFNKQWETASRFEAYYKLQKHFSYVEEIVQFFYEMQPTYQLKKYYNTFVRQPLRESAELVQINRLLSFHNFFSVHQVRVQKQKKNVLQSRVIRTIQAASVQQKIDIVDSDLQDILTSNHTNNLLDPLQYSKLYLEMISYTNNIHDTDQQKRTYLSQFYSKNVPLDISGQKENYTQVYQLNTENEISLSLIRMLKLCQKQSHLSLETSTKNESESQKHTRDSKDQKIDTIKFLYRELIDHIFLLDLGCFKFFMTYLEKIFTDSIFNLQEKVRFFFQVKHNRKWSGNRVSKKKNVSRFYFCKQIAVLLHKWYQYLFDECQSSLKQALILVQINDLKDFKQRIQKLKAQISRQLYFELSCEYIDRIFEASQQENTQNAASQIYMQLPWGSRRKVLPFMITMAEDLLTKNSVKKYTAIMGLIISNIRSIDVLSSLMVYHNYLCKKQTQNKEVLHIGCKWKVIKDLNLVDMILHFRQIDLLVEELILCKNSLCKISPKQVQNQHQTIGKTTKKLVIFAKFYLFEFYLRQPRENKSHYPLVYYHLSTSLKILAMLTNSYVNQNQLSLLRQHSRFIQCRTCKQQLQIFLLHFQQYLIVSSNYHDKEESLQKLHRLLEQLKSTRHQKEPFTFHRLFRNRIYDFDHHHNMVSLCILNPSFEQKYHGIANYFKLLKNNQCFDQFFEKRGNLFSLIENTLKVLFYSAKQDLFDFLLSTSQYLTIISSHQLMEMVKIAFKSTIMYQNLDISSVALMLYSYAATHHCHDKLLFYYSSIHSGSLSKAVKNKIQLQICKNLEGKQVAYSEFIERQLYSMILIDYLIKKRDKAKNSRKIVFYMNRTIKLSRRIGMPNIKKSKRKKVKNEKQKALRDKIDRIDCWLSCLENKYFMLVILDVESLYL